MPPTIVTPKALSTPSMGLAIVFETLPANSNPTALGNPSLGLALPDSTISEPESPPALNPPGVIEIWLTNRATLFEAPPHSAE